MHGALNSRWHPAGHLDETLRKQQYRASSRLHLLPPGFGCVVRAKANRTMTTALSLIWFLLLLVMLVLWGFAFWKKPQLAAGVLIGALAAIAVALLYRAADFHEIPVWLPALPFAVVAVALFGFGVLAWYWGKTD
jgi:hypothetical protein